MLTGRTIGTALALVACLQTQEKKISKKGIPPAVLAAFQKTYSKAVIKTVSKEKQDGKTTYEIESLEGVTARDLQYLSDGTVVEIEESLPSSELPESVKTSAAARYPKGKIVKAEKITKGLELSYGLGIKRGGTRVFLEVDPSGKVLKEEKAKGK